MAENSTISAFPLGVGPGMRRASGRQTPNPYVQVALTYLRRPFSSPQGWAVSVLFLMMYIGSFLVLPGAGRHDIGAGPMQMQLTLAIALFAFASHVKSQFADSRARLTPGFRRVHAAVAAAMALLLAVLLPAMFAWLAGLHSVGLVALMVFLFGMILCSVALHSRLCSWLIVFAVFATYAEPARTLLWQLLSGAFEAQAFALLALGAAISLFGGIRLVCLNEDMPAYHPQMRGGWAGQYQASGQAPAGAGILWALRERFMESNMARSTNHARRASTSRWSAVCRWRVGMVDGWTSWLVGVGVVLAVQFVAAWIAARGRPEPSTSFWWWTFVVWLIACPSIMSLSQLARRSYVLGYEIMLPVQRRTYLKQAGMAVAISCLRTWGGMVVAFMLWWITTAPESFRFGTVVNVLACSVLAQVGLLGIGLYLTWLAGGDSSPIMLFVVVGAIWGVLFFTVMVGYMLNESPLPGLANFLLPLAGAALFAMFGLLLTRLAYHRWLVADFD